MEATLHQDIQSFDVNIVLVQLEFLGRLQEAAIHTRELLTSSKVNKKFLLKVKREFRSKLHCRAATKSKSNKRKSNQQIAQQKNQTTV